MVDPASSPCPRCGGALFEGRLDAAALLGCGRCGGVWLDSAASRAVVEGAGRAWTPLSEQAAAHATHRPDTSASGLACPACARALTRGTVPGTTVAIDTCADHGTWFDPGELRVVALAFAKLPEPMTVSLAAYEAREDRGRWFPARHGRWELDDRGRWVFHRNSYDDDVRDAVTADGVQALVDGVAAFVDAIRGRE